MKIWTPTALVRKIKETPKRKFICYYTGALLQDCITKDHTTVMVISTPLWRLLRITQALEYEKIVCLVSRRLGDNVFDYLAVRSGGVIPRSITTYAKKLEGTKLIQNRDFWGESIHAYHYYKERGY